MQLLRGSHAQFPKKLRIVICIHLRKISIFKAARKEGARVNNGKNPIGKEPNSCLEGVEAVLTEPVFRASLGPACAYCCCWECQSYARPSHAPSPGWSADHPKSRNLLQVDHGRECLLFSCKDKNSAVSFPSEKNRLWPFTAASSNYTTKNSS